jgi:hypothetical protein
LHDEAVDREFKYTELWMVPSSGLTIVGIKNSEQKPEKYDIEISGDGQVIAAWRGIAVKADETWTRALTISLDFHKVEAKLYNEEGLYRKVSHVFKIGE